MSTLNTPFWHIFFMSPWYNIFGGITMRLKELRKQKKLRQQDVADAINCSQAVYSRYENGEREPSKIVLNSLADFYNVSVDYILGRDQEELAPDAITPALLTREERMLQMFRQMDEKQQDAFIKWLEKR